jgi:hypothetical protein
MHRADKLAVEKKSNMVQTTTCAGKEATLAEIRFFLQSPHLMRRLAKFRYPRSTLLGRMQRRMRIRRIRVPRGWIDLCVRMYVDDHAQPTARFLSDLRPFLSDISRRNGDVDPLGDSGPSATARQMSPQI